MKTGAIVFPLRIVQLLLSLVVLGLSAYVANWYNVDTLTSSPTQINFLIFAPSWSILSIVYLEAAPRFFPRASHPWIALGVEVFNVLFYFAGFVALAVFLSGLLFCRGTVCAAARADTFFAALQWALWTATAVLGGMDIFKLGGARGKPSRAAMQAAEMKQAGAAGYA